PLAFGVPLSTPLTGSSVMPFGSAPVNTDHVYGGTPPVACSVCEYATPTVPAATDGVTICSAAGLTTNEKARVAGVGPPVTWTMKLNVPGVVGVPLNTPVAGSSISPPGRLPTVTDQP